MIDFSYFIEHKNDFKHHALLLLNTQFEHQDLPTQALGTIIKEYCQLELNPFPTTATTISPIKIEKLKKKKDKEKDKDKGNEKDSDKDKDRDNDKETEQNKVQLKGQGKEIHKDSRDKEEDNLDEIPYLHNDIFIADRKRSILRLEDIETIKKQHIYPPIQAKKRLFVVERCGRLNTHAANALLKIMEEPHAFTLFLFTAQSVRHIPATLASRMQKIQIDFPEFNKHSVLESIKEEDRQWIADRIFALPTDVCYLSESLSQRNTVKKKSPLKTQECIERCERLTKEYDVDQLRDIIVHYAGDRLKRDATFLQGARLLLSTVSRWKDHDGLHPSCFLWLLRILL